MMSWIVPAISTALAGTVLLTLVYMLLGYVHRVRADFEAKEEHIRLVTKEGQTKDTKYRILFENSNDSVLLIALDKDNKPGQILDVNNGACERLGYTREEMLSMSAEGVLGNGTGGNSGFMANPCSGVTLNFEGYQIAKGGRVVPVLNSAHCFTLEGRDVVLINSRDLTLLRKTENSLKESEERLSSILEGSFEGISITENGKVVDANPRMAEMLGYTLDELIGQKVADFVAPGSIEVVSRMMNEEHGGVYEHEALKKDGSVINVEVRGNETSYKGRPVRITAIRDISYRIRVEERLRATLEEKEILLNEVRHRVKTNLQGVLGLLDFQASSLRDEEAHRAFRESQNRILTMALIHEKLYEVDNLNRIDFGSVVENLASHLARVYRTSEAGVRIDTEIDGVKLNMDTAIPCGLIINELVSGLLQNGGAAEPDSRVAVKMTQCAQKGFELMVARSRDDNYGHVVAQAMSSPSKLLVESLVEQLSGTMNVSVEKGTSYKIAFMEYFEAGTELH